jgi:hypothetical protein
LSEDGSNITDEQLQEAAKILGIDFPVLYEALINSRVVHGERTKVKYAENVVAVVRHSDGTKDVFEAGDNLVKQ